MFYAAQLLARKGPLGLVWLAAHAYEQLKRSQVASAHLPGTVDCLLHPETPLALRLSGQLLLGVVRLYTQQLQFLHQDCHDALVRIRLAVVALHTGNDERGPMTLARGGVEVQFAMADGLDAAWGSLVDMVEVQLMSGHDMLASLSQDATGQAGLLLAEMQLPHASDEEGVSDVRLTRDQRRAHGQPSSASAGKGKATPSASMRSESLFATVSLSMGGSMGGNRSRAGAPAASLLHSGARANSKMQLGSTRGRDQAAGDLAMQEEMFDHADLAFDLDEVEVERLREAPPSAARGGEGEGLAARLQAVRELGLQPLGALTSPAEHSEQGSAGPLSPLSTNPAGIGLKAQLASAGSPGLPQASAGSDGLMDMGMGSGGVADLLPADFGDTGMGLMGMDVDQPDLAEGGDPAGLLLQPGTQPEDAVGGGGSGGRRRSVRLHTGQLEGAAAPPPPTAPSSAAATGGRPFRPASLKGMQLSPSALPTTVAAGVLARGPKVGSKQPPLAPLSTAGKAAARATTQLLAHRKRPALDLPGPGDRSGRHATVLPTADCRALIKDRSSLLVERGLPVWRAERASTRLDPLGRQPAAEFGRLGMTGSSQAGQEALDPELWAGMPEPTRALLLAPALHARGYGPRLTRMHTAAFAGQLEGVPAGLALPQLAPPPPSLPMTTPGPGAHTAPPVGSSPAGQPQSALANAPTSTSPTKQLLASAFSDPASGGAPASLAVQPVPRTALAERNTPFTGPSPAKRPRIGPTHSSPQRDQENRAPAPTTSQHQASTPPSGAHAPPSAPSLSLPPPPSKTDAAGSPVRNQASRNAQPTAAIATTPHASTGAGGPSGVPPLPGSVAGLGLGSQFVARTRPRNVAPATTPARASAMQTPVPPLASTGHTNPAQAYPTTGPFLTAGSSQGGDAQSGWILRSSSGTGSGSQDDSVLPRRSAGVLCTVARAVLSQLPPELQSQASQLPWAHSTLQGQLWDEAPGSSSAVRARGASQPPPSLPGGAEPQGVELSQALSAGQAVPLQQILPPNATRLQASRAFFDLLALHSRGLVAMNQQQPLSHPTPRQAGPSQGTSSNDIMLCLTQQGAENLSQA